MMSMMMLMMKMSRAPARPSRKAAHSHPGTFDLVKSALSLLYWLHAGQWSLSCHHCWYLNFKNTLSLTSFNLALPEEYPCCQPPEQMVCLGSSQFPNRPPYLSLAQIWSCSWKGHFNHHNILNFHQFYSPGVAIMGIAVANTHLKTSEFKNTITLFIIVNIMNELF